jgi:hypothetical protein
MSWTSCQNPASSTAMIVVLVSKNVTLARNWVSLTDFSGVATLLCSVKTPTFAKSEFDFLQQVA